MKKIFYILIILSLFLGFSCSSGSDDAPAPQAVHVERPIIYPASGDYKEGFKKVTIESKTPNAEIYYTTDGSTPTSLSYRYVGEFPVIGSKTVKAVAMYGNGKSSVATSRYNLNFGKNKNQLGVIYGKVNLSDVLSDAVKEKVKNDTVYVFSDDLPGVVKQTKIGEEFYFDGLDTSKAYSFFFTNKEPGNVNNGRAANTVEENGKPILASFIENQQPVEGAGLNIDATLKATGTISGTVKRYGVTGDPDTDNGGVVVYIPGTSYSAYTDKDGKFTMSGVPQGMYTIRAQYPNYTTVEKENVLLQKNDDSKDGIPTCIIKEPLEIKFAEGMLKGAAVLNDVSANENSGINVVITSVSKNNNKQTSDPQFSYNATTTANGFWSSLKIYPGTYTIEFSKSGYTPVVLDDIVVTGAKTCVVPSVTLQVIGGSLKGSVSLNGKSDKSGVGILLKKTVTTDSPKEKSYYGLSDNNGNFAFDNVMPGTYKVIASYPGFTTVETTGVVVSKGDNIQGIVLPEMTKSSYSVTGKVILEGLTNGFEGTDVVLTDAQTQKPVLTTTTDKNGIYCFNDVKVGTYIIVASRDGYLTSNDKFTSVNASTVTSVEDILLKNAKGSIMGTVTLESSINFEGINILLKSNETNKTYTTVTDTDGKYSFAGIEPGNWTIQATKTGYNTKFTPSFTVSAGAITEPGRIELPVSMRSIYGNVTLEGRDDFTGVRITATKTTSTTEIYSALSNKQGFYALTGMTPGEYILSYSYEGYVSQTSSSVNVTTNSTAQLDAVSLRKATGKITGVVKLEGCTDRSGIKVYLVGTDHVYTTKADGVYNFQVPAGNYPGGVRFEKEDFATTAKADTIPVLNDSTYAVLDMEMKCNAITVKGKIEVANATDHSNVKVSIDGNDDKRFVTTTAKDGTWEMKHVPLGYTTFRFEKEFAADVTTEILVEPGLSLDLGSIQMIPDAASLHGYVYLKDMSDNRNIIVTVKTPNKPDVIVRTTSDGKFEATNIMASGKHTVTFSKDGWNSYSTEVSNLQPMQTTVIGQNREFVLTDTTAPIWANTKPVTINSGANHTNKSKIKVELLGTDVGSGIEQMSIQVARASEGTEGPKFPANYRWTTYNAGFDFDLYELPQNMLGQGEYVLYIALKDRCGNISEYSKKSITLTNVVTTLSGILSGDKLNLTKQCSPYLVDADCLVPENETLVINPGTEIRFDGNYSIAVGGTIKARGTKEEPIVFTKSDDANIEIEHNGYYDENTHQYVDQDKEYVWKGIYINAGTLIMDNGYNYSDGNIMEYCNFNYALDPLNVVSPSYINNCDFNYCVNPVIVKSTNTFVTNNNFTSGLDFQYPNNNKDDTIFVINNIIIGKCTVNSDYVILKNNTFRDASISLQYPAIIENNSFEKSNFYVSLYESEKLLINNNNFIDCPSPLFTTRSEYKSGKNYNIKGNYYGIANTDELNSKGNKANISFIKDYYDDFKLMRFDYSDWAQTSFENNGYSETGFILFDFIINGSNNNYTELKDEKLKIEIQSLLVNNDFTSYRIAQSIEDIKKASWMPYQQFINYTIDKNNLTNGMATIFIQLKDSKNNISSFVRKEVPYNTAPTATINIKDGSHYKGNSKDIQIDLDYYDNASVSKSIFMLDGIYFDTLYHSDSNVLLPVSYLSQGKHTIKYIVYDSLGNEGFDEKTIYVDRNVDNTIYSNKTFDATTGQLNKDSDTSYLWHFDTDGTEVDNTSGTKLTVLPTRGGFKGNAQIQNCELPITINPEEFTIEFWSKGDKFDISINKSLDICDYTNNNRFAVYTKDVIRDRVEENWIDFDRTKDDHWHYYAFTLKGKTMACYRDGVIIRHLTFKDNINITQNPMNIHTSYGASLDELRISKKARSCDEITTYYKAAKKILDSNLGSIDAIIW